MTTLAPPAVSSEDQAAVHEIVQRITQSWKAQDAGGLSTVYAEDASIILPGANLKGLPQIREFMARAFATKWKGTQVLGQPLELRYLRDDVLLLVSQGGAYAPGASEVPEENAIRGMWIFVKQDGKWTIAAYGNTPTRAPIPIPDALQ